jgi:hypothetical protein
MKRETIFLKIVVVLMGIPVLGICIFVLPVLGDFEEWIPKFAYLQYPFLIGMYITAIAFFYALYQTLKLLSYIDKNNAFTDLSVKALKNIKTCAITISCLYVLEMPIFVLMGDADDSPGLVAVGLLIMFASIVIAVFAAVLQKLLINAIDIKSENDLTV